MKSAVQNLAECEDEKLLQLALSGIADAFGEIVTRYNQQLYRAARAILRDGDEAEDAVQEAYLRAYAGLCNFRRESSLGTWLTRIVVNESLGRLRRQRTHHDLDVVANRPQSEIIPFPGSGVSLGPEQNAAIGEIRRYVERAIDELPESFRVVFVLRDVEGLSVEETSQQVGISEATVKTRLHRARRMLREDLDDTLSQVFKDAFPFGGLRCARMRENVMKIILDT